MTDTIETRLARVESVIFPGGITTTGTSLYLMPAVTPLRTGNSRVYQVCGLGQDEKIAAVFNGGTAPLAASIAINPDGKSVTVVALDGGSFAAQEGRTISFTISRVAKLGLPGIDFVQQILPAYRKYTMAEIGAAYAAGAIPSNPDGTPITPDQIIP